VTDSTSYAAPIALGSRLHIHGVESIAGLIIEKKITVLSNLMCFLSTVEDVRSSMVPRSVRLACDQFRIWHFKNRTAQAPAPVTIGDLIPTCNGLLFV
jgi:hypothetical protein